MTKRDVFLGYVAGWAFVNFVCMPLAQHTKVFDHARAKVATEIVQQMKKEFGFKTGGPVPPVRGPGPYGF